MQESQRQQQRLQDQLLASEEAAKTARDAAAAARRETASLQAGADAAQAEAVALRQRVAAAHDEVGTPTLLATELVRGRQRHLMPCRDAAVSTPATAQHTETLASRVSGPLTLTAMSDW